MKDQEPIEPIDPIKKHIINKLQKGLSPSLTYHTVDHTLDVLEQVVSIAEAEEIQAEEVFLLQVAALYHDTGFLYQYAGHEEKSCQLAQAELPGFGLSGEQIQQVCGMIRATKIPQSPTTELEQIICDADLDYLGRKDFFSIGKTLFKEFVDQQIVGNFREWNNVQIKFLESHSYFTKRSVELRNKRKLLHLAEVRALV
ncbi:MAG: HD domain-containing protein [Saprospiraceae bacterium]|nr:HD domain-containing protein [Saprospiraceae bacterium]